MALIVQKYGGSSVANAEKILRVAQRVIKTKKAGNKVVVVVSAMGDMTDDLITLADQINKDPRYMDYGTYAKQRGKIRMNEEN